MELKDKTILILGGSGLVGRAVTRRLLAHHPDKVVLVALYESEVEEAAGQLRAEAGRTTIEIDWGNVFLPVEAAKLDRVTMLADDELRRLVIDDLLGDLTPAVLQRSFLYQLFERYKPHVVVDCINTATAFAYQDVFHSARDLLDAAHEGRITTQQVEGHVLTLTMPQLIRHIQLMVEAMRVAGTEAYAKIGTSGTGGMGLNIPYTHSEERPSRTLLSKSAVAGAQSLLLFLVGRTPGAPATIEIKPTTAIAWREIGFGPIRQPVVPLGRFDCPKPLAIDAAFGPRAAGWHDTGAVLESVYINTGENGLFARSEFETVTALGQMEFITPEEVADYVIMELLGRPTGRDIVAALDSATAGPTYQAGILRAAAIQRLQELEDQHGVRSIAFEKLGPPRLTKLLYESHILSLLRRSVRDLADSDPAELSREAVQLIQQDGGLRSLILSVGIPITVPGPEVLRGEKVVVPFAQGDDIERTVFRGWVDLRVENCRVWVSRAQLMVEQASQRPEGSGSDVEWGAIEAHDQISPSKCATWIFRYEDGGERIKR